MKSRNSFSWKRLLASPVTLIIVLAVFVVLARAAWTMVNRAKLAAERLGQVEAQSAKLQASQKKLSDEITGLSSPGGIEADLREKYHAVTPGESVAVIVDSPSAGGPDPNQSASALSASSTATGESWWRKLLDFFGL